MIRKDNPKTAQKLPNCRILGIRIDAIPLKRVLSLLGKWVESNKQYQIVTPNPEQVVLAQENHRFREVLNQADLAIPDGIGLVWAARFKGKSLNKRVAGADLMVEACRLAAEKDWKVFLLGGEPGVARQVAGVLNNLTMKQFNNELKIAYFEGSKDIKSETNEERKKTVRAINDFKPDLLFVAYGAPYQELWIAENLPQLEVKVAMGVGGAFDFLAGKAKRAPKIWRSLGLEWLFRLLKQPWRWRRQLNLVKFGWLVITKKDKTNAWSGNRTTRYT